MARYATAKAVGRPLTHVEVKIVSPETGEVVPVGEPGELCTRGYPREIEELLFSHPDVVEAQVVGVRDEHYGEELCAWIRVRAGAELDANAVRDFCRSRIARYKVPRHAIFADAFPMTVTGKPQKVKLRELSIAQLGLDRAAAA